MNEETFGALKRIVKEVEEKRKAECLMKDCIINHIIGGDDIDLVKEWMKEEKFIDEAARAINEAIK